jgi:hypothetical protein
MDLIQPSFNYLLLLNLLAVCHLVLAGFALYRLAHYNAGRMDKMILLLLILFILVLGPLIFIFGSRKSRPA